MSEIQPFNFPATGQAVRSVLLDGEPWFVAADVTDILGYANGRDAVSRLPERMRNSVALADGNRGNPNRSVINALAEMAHRQHVVPMAGRVLAYERWRKPHEGIAAFAQLTIDLDLPGVERGGAHGGEISA